MPSRPTKRQTNKKRSSFKVRRSDSKLQRLAFILIFALVGLVFLWQAFAATATTSFSGSLNKKQTTRSHQVVTTANGSLTATASVTKGNSNLTLRLLSGSTVIATVTGSPATLSAPVGTGSFSLEVSSTSPGNTNYTMTVSYPIADPTPILDTTAPTAPTSLTATTISTTQINLAWQSSTDNIGVSGYDVYRGSTKLTTVMTTSYSDVNLSPSTAYSYSVKARDAAGNTSASSNTASATTLTPADTTAPGLTVDAPTASAIIKGTTNVTGTASDNVALSKVEVQVDTNGYVPATGTTSWTYALNTTLYPDGGHNVIVKATDTSGNTKTVIRVVTIDNIPDSTSTAPNTQGTWVSPEGLTIDVNTVRTNVNTGKLWTIADVYTLFRNETAAPGDFATVAPTVTVFVQDTSAAATTTLAGSSGGVYSEFEAYIYLGGSGSTTFWSSTPQHVVAHEYGHAWTLYHLYMSNAGDWSSYLNFRWANADGSVRLANDSRLESSYAWSKAEIIADDYRLLFGSALASSQLNHLNPYIPPPANVPGLRDFFLNSWAK